MLRRETIRVTRPTAPVVIDACAGCLLVAGVKLHREHAVARFDRVLEASPVIRYTSVVSKVNKRIPGGARQGHVDRFIRCGGGNG